MLCILYVTAVGVLLGIAALLAERALPAWCPRRIVWCVVMPVSIFLPGYYRFHHAVPVSSLLATPSGPMPQERAISASSISALNADWWAHAEAYDDTINRLWHVASIALILWGLAGAVRVALIVARSRRRRGSPGAPALLDGVPILVTDSVGPATVGLFRARVLVPRWVLRLSVMQRKYVLRHEDEHRRAHDADLLFFGSLMIVLAPWNLALWWQLRRLHLAIEMDCDDRVVAALGDPTAYGEMLLEVAQSRDRGPSLQPALLGGMGMLERRLTALLAPAPLRQAHRFLLPALAVGLVLVVLWTPHPIVAHLSHSTAAHVTSASSSPSTQR
jgi:bla regulator protein blaR1